MLTIEVSRDICKKCDIASHNFWCNKKPGTYGKGLCNTEYDPHKATRVGLLGECAVAIYLGIPLPNMHYVRGGRTHDLLYKDKKIEIKTATHNYGSILIYYKNEKGSIIDLQSDIYVGCVAHENKESCMVDLIGWLERDEIDKVCRIKRGTKGKHYNKVIKYKYLHNIHSLKNI